MSELREVVDIDEEMQEPSEARRKSRVYIPLDWLILLIWDKIKQVVKK